MMSFNCPHCGQKNNIRKQTLGTIRRCDNCRASIKIPEVNSQEELTREMNRQAAELQRLAREQAHAAELDRIEWENRTAAEREWRKEARAEDDARNRVRAKQALETGNTILYVTLIVGGAFVFMCLFCCGISTFLSSSKSSPSLTSPSKK
jgi:acyl-CoA thioesterase